MKLSDLVYEEIIEKAKNTRKEKAENPKRGRKRKKKKTFYFTQETENAIILYNKLSWIEEDCMNELGRLYEELAELQSIILDDEYKKAKLSDIHHKIKRMTTQLEYSKKLNNTYRSDEIEYWKNRIFSEYIKYPLEKIVENMYNKHKLSYFDAPPDHVQAEAVHNLLLNLHKYDESKGTKAFSYFTVVAKHYLYQTNNSNHRRYKRSTLLSTMPENWEVEDNFYQRQHENEMEEFTNRMLEFWEKNLRIVFTKKRDMQIADAVLELFRRSGSIENYNKKHLYVLIREMTNHKTQYITRVVNTMRETQEEMLEEFRRTGDIVDVKESFDSIFKW